MTFLTAFGAGIFLLGLGSLLSILRVQRRCQGVVEWPSVTGEIMDAFVYRHQRRTLTHESVTYTPVVAYTYTVDGQLCESRKLSLSAAADSTYDQSASAKAIVADYQKGKKLSVYYNPHNPKQAVLQKPKPIDHRSELFFGVVNMLIGAGMAILTLVAG